MKRCLMAAFIKFTKRARGGGDGGKAGGCSVHAQMKGGCSVHAQMKRDMAESEEEVHCRGICEDSPGLDSPPGWKSSRQSSSGQRTCVSTIHARSACG